MQTDMYIYKASMIDTVANQTCLETTKMAAEIRWEEKKQKDESKTMPTRPWGVGITINNNISAYFRCSWIICAVLTIKPLLYYFCLELLVMHRCTSEVCLKKKTRKWNLVATCSWSFFFLFLMSWRFMLGLTKRAFFAENRVPPSSEERIVISSKEMGNNHTLFKSSVIQSYS